MLDSYFSKNLKEGVGVRNIAAWRLLDDCSAIARRLLDPAPLSGTAFVPAILGVSYLTPLEAQQP